MSSSTTLVPPENSSFVEELITKNTELKKDGLKDARSIKHLQDEVAELRKAREQARKERDLATKERGMAEHECDQAKATILNREATIKIFEWQKESLAASVDTAKVAHLEIRVKELEEKVADEVERSQKLEETQKGHTAEVQSLRTELEMASTSKTQLKSQNTRLMNWGNRFVKQANARQNEFSQIRRRGEGEARTSLQQKRPAPQEEENDVAASSKRLKAPDKEFRPSTAHPKSHASEEEQFSYAPGYSTPSSPAQLNLPEPITPPAAASGAKSSAKLFLKGPSRRPTERFLMEHHKKKPKRKAVEFEPSSTSGSMPGKRDTSESEADEPVKIPKKKPKRETMKAEPSSISGSVPGKKGTSESEV